MIAGIGRDYNLWILILGLQKPGDLEPLQGDLVCEDALTLVVIID